MRYISSDQNTRLDSMSHAHDGPGGFLEWHEEEVDRMAGGDGIALGGYSATVAADQHGAVIRQTKCLDDRCGQISHLIGDNAPRNIALFKLNE